MSMISAKRLEHMDYVDTLPAGLRECVHELGLPIVRAFIKFGIRNPVHIREIVREVWLGPRQDGQRNDVRNVIDSLLSRGIVSYAGLARVMQDNNLAIVSREPTRAMLDASMAEVSGYNVRCSREEKHRRRLRAAIQAAVNGN